MNSVHDTVAYDSLGRKEEREGGWKGGREGWTERGKEKKGGSQRRRKREGEGESQRFESIS